MPSLSVEALAEAIAVHEKVQQAFIKNDSLVQLILVNNMEDSNAELTVICNTAECSYAPTTLRILKVYECVGVSPTEERSVNKLTERLRFIGMRLLFKTADSTALVATRKKIFKKPERKCYMYRKPGYLAKDCWKKERKPKVEGDAFVCTVECGLLTVEHQLT
ncbi:CCHC-type domain-containing protein [Trichonephila inaurata madagascariensis]|uniref:CCHC-type domain-containing protein n=1 Tax=Trichonephila inaurata madagascariensis TaxID=2747483 RepID=A0A8X6X519_9ARAC|nr:CCHC-type domain-containing protein [Trichonephila inaurata madagascariensis]